VCVCARVLVCIYMWVGVGVYICDCDRAGERPFGDLLRFAFTLNVMSSSSSSSSSWSAARPRGRLPGDLDRDGVDRALLVVSTESGT